MNETKSPSGRFNLMERKGLTVTPKYKRLTAGSRSARTLPSKHRQNAMMESAPKTPMTTSRFNLRARGALTGMTQKWEGGDHPTQFQREQTAVKRGGNIEDVEQDLEYGDAEELLDRPTGGGAKPKNPENREKVFEAMDPDMDTDQSVSKSPKKRAYQTKTNTDTKSYGSKSSNIPTSVMIGTRKLDLKNYNLLDDEDWSRIGKGSRIAYEKKDGKIVEGNVVHALYANKKDPHDENEYMLMEAYNFKPGKKGTFKWPLKYSEIKHLWMHPGQSHIMEKDRDLRNKFDSSIDTKRTVRDPIRQSSSSNSSGIDSALFSKLKNNVDNNGDNLNELLRKHEELTRKNDKLETDMENIMSFLTRKFSNQFQPSGYFPPVYPGTQDSNMQSQVL
jgi:hypothetical protein